jgi:RNA polymerase sigma factor (sigma-70 family)
LQHRIANLRRTFRAARRSIRREVTLEARSGSTTRRATALKSATTPASEKAMRAERAAALTKSLDLLPPRSRSIIEMHWQENLTFEAIGNRLGGDSPDAVRVAYARALTRLKNLLGSGHDPH